MIKLAEDYRMSRFPRTEIQRVLNQRRKEEREKEKELEYMEEWF